MGSPADFAGMLDFINQHQIKPLIDAVFQLSDNTQAFERMREGKQSGKMIHCFKT